MILQDGGGRPLTPIRRTSTPSAGIWEPIRSLTPSPTRYLKETKVAGSSLGASEVVERDGKKSVVSDIHICGSERFSNYLL
jgi:hypothetical protein